MSRICVLDLAGEAVEKSDDEAMRYFNMAADLGDPMGVSPPSAQNPKST